MNVGICYVCPVVKWESYEPIARRFIASFSAFPPGGDYDFHLICNGGPATSDIKQLFAAVNPIYHEHDNTGWDIGAFASMKDVACEDMLFLGANTLFRKAGWMGRLLEARQRFGQGLFGTSASYDIYPHIRTNGFLCHPSLVRLAWEKNQHKPNLKARHHFELGRTSLTDTALGKGLPVILVTWDGYYERKSWRVPENVYRRGDQGNCLIYDRQHEIYDASDPKRKTQLEKIANGNKYEFYKAAIQSRIGKYI